MENSVLSGKVSKEYTLRKPCSLEMRKLNERKKALEEKDKEREDKLRQKQIEHQLYEEELSKQKEKEFLETKRNQEKKNQKVLKRQEKEIGNVKKRADIEKQLRYELQNERYKYHLIHHHHDLYVDKSLLNLNEQVSSNSYKPKLEYVFKKIIYSPEFNKMSGRYDQELKRGINENKK